MGALSMGGEGIGLFGILIGVGLFIFFSYCMKLICDKANVDPGILIWIPLVQLIPMAKVAGINPWLLLLYLVPIVNIAFAIYHWAKVSTAIGKSPWLAALLIIPIANMALLPILAFT